MNVANLKNLYPSILTMVLIMFADSNSVVINLVAWVLTQLFLGYYYGDWVVEAVEETMRGTLETRKVRSLQQFIFNLFYEVSRSVT